MQFIPDGPDVPERLIRAHEEGNVIFFCGAGVSYPAGLKGFDWLVNELYARLGRSMTGAELVANKLKQYDAQLSLVERDISEGRKTLRGHLPEVLKPVTQKRGALLTHRALLELARDRSDRTRLVTTNFDRLFVKAGKKLNHLSAPHLPTPKRSRWDGVVYLHGLMDESPKTDNLNRLVLTSGDFGLAYLNERWASRFVSDLFAKYTVCFVGYSADDVVLRYMLDALSADELQGEKRIEVFALAGADCGEEEKVREDWRVKGVTAVLYDAIDYHRALHDTLRTWAATYRDGLTGRRGVALRESRLVPDKLSNSGSIERLLWALNEPSGEVAKAFALAEPVPSVEWLEAFTENKFGRGDLELFGILPSQIPARDTSTAGELTFSLIRHPSAPAYSAWTSLASRGESIGGLDNMSAWLIEWLCRHLDKVETILWVAKSGGRLHPLFRERVRHAIAQGNLEAPLSHMWEIIAAGYCGSPTNGTQFYGWAAAFPKTGYSALEKTTLAMLLRPRINFKRPFSPARPPRKNSRPKRAGDLVGWDIHLDGGAPHDALEHLKSRANWQKFLVDALPMLKQSLLTCMEVMAHIGEAGFDHDLSAWHQPSISPHGQNNQFNEWTTLIELCREGWDAAAKLNGLLAYGEFRRWRTYRYLVFRRLAMYAATNSLIGVDDALDLLVEGNALWLEDCKRETIQLLMHVAPRLNKSQRSALLSRIVEGPPRRLYRKTLSDDDWAYVREKTIWVRLIKWAASGTSLTGRFLREFRRLNDAHPEWANEPAEQLEFTTWMSVGNGDLRTVRALPRDPELLISALTKRTNTLFEVDDWGVVCANEPDLAREILKELARREVWLADVWQDALAASTNVSQPLLTIDEFASIFARAPTTFLTQASGSLPWWLKLQAASVPDHARDDFFAICKKILDALLQKSLSETDDFVGQAINHPIGRTIEAVLQNWFSTRPKPGAGLGTPYRELLATVCGREKVGHISGLVIASANLFALFTADPDWAREWVIPHFDWSRDKRVAQAAWEGYLWTPRIDQHLFDALQGLLGSTSKHYELLGKHRSQFASLLVWTLMEVAHGSSVGALAQSLSDLPPDGLSAAADALSNSIANRGELLADYLDNRVERAYPKPWPKSVNKRSEAEARAIALFCVRTGPQFAKWLRASEPFLHAFPDIYLVAAELHKSGLCNTEPEAALDLIERIVPDRPYPTTELAQCLEEIRTAMPPLGRRASFRRLWEISQAQR